MRLRSHGGSIASNGGGVEERVFHERADGRPVVAGSGLAALVRSIAAVAISDSIIAVDRGIGAAEVAITSDGAVGGVSMAPPGQECTVVGVAFVAR